MNMSLALLLLVGLTFATAENQHAIWTIPSGEEVVSLTGKMNVPKRGSNLHRPGRGMVAIWPALKGANFFMQTCLIDGSHISASKGYGWVDAAYHGVCAGKGECNCRQEGAKQCDDSTGKQRNFAKEGSTISWYIEKRDQLWVAGFSSSDGQSSEVWMKMEGKADNHVTALLVEGSYDSADETPKEPLEVWDIVAKNPQGKSFDMTFSCNQGGRQFSHINCNWKDGNRKGVQLTFGKGFNDTLVV
jgi:hypothetical protein